LRPTSDRPPLLSAERDDTGPAGRAAAHPRRGPPAYRGGARPAAGAGVVEVAGRPDAAVAAGAAPVTMPTLTVVVASSAWPTVAAALAAVPPGGTLLVDRSEAIASPLIVDRSMTVLFAPTVRLTATAHITMIDVRASDVRVVDAALVGAGSSRAASGKGVVATGTATAPLERLSIEDCTFTGLSHSAVVATSVVGLEVVGCRVDDVGYAGVVLVSCTDAVVRGCTVTEVRQPAGFVNSYGIAVTRDETKSLVDSPRSARVTIDGNTVRGVRLWEGIDTHAGQQIVIRDNTVSGCSVGIAVVPCQNDATPQEYVYAPVDVVVAGNHVERGDSPGTGSGIVVKGAGSTVGSEAERASAVVEDNVVVGMGGGDREAGVLLYLTRDVVVRGNLLSGCVGRGVCLYHSNDATMLVGNRVEGVVPAAGATVAAAVEVRSSANTATLVGNSYAPGPDSSGSAASVRGVAVPGSGNVLDLLRNDWTATVLPVWGRSSTITRFADGA
jgi:nitrous oxidase accessory protein NosD